MEPKKKEPTEVSILYLHKMTGIDRKTIATYLEPLSYKTNKYGAKLYPTALALMTIFGINQHGNKYHKYHR
jgi:hypothetical protein